MAEPGRAHATEIFLAAASLPPAEREALLARECGGDPALRRQVEHLLANDRDDAFLAARTRAEGTASDAEAIGPYRVLSRLGEGGMGEVFLAERKDLGQRVAIKVIKPGMDSRAILARFEAERQALARMEHSNIAKVLDAGATPQGRPYFVMEYVKGIPITRYADENKLPVEERLRLFQQVCSGVQHAHSKGVIHRDLTPNNVLVTVQDGKPAAKIIDFGLARATDHRLTEKTVFTEQGVIMGTPEYMSPEQAGLGGLDIDTRTDVYTLGVMLYELLTGELPFSREELRVAGYEGMCRTIREKEPERPSTRITRSGTAKVASLRRTEGERLLKRLRGDLDWVVLKCLEKDRTRRYETPTHLADDLQRHLEDEVVMARAPSAGYRLRKLARRYRGQLIAVAAVLGALVSGLALAMYFWVDAADQAQRADQEAKEAKHQAGIADAERQEAKRQATIADDRAREAEAAKVREAQKVREFNLLAADVYLREALATEKTLYPPWPGKDGARIRAMQRWLEVDVGRLLAMKPEIDATVQALRERGLPATPEEVELDKTTHPRHGEWQLLSAQLAALSRARAIREGRQDLVLPPATAVERAMNPAQLNTLAWERVTTDESKRIWGQEARALMLARLAWDSSPASDEPSKALAGHTLAWAWFANGKDTEAIAQSEATVALAPDAEKPRYRESMASLRASVHAASGKAGNDLLASLQQRLAQLTTMVEARRTYRFADESQRFLHDTLRELGGRLTALEGEQRKAVSERLHWAERIESLTMGHPRSRVTWQAARTAIGTADGIVASPLYRKHQIELTPQMGLVPIGMNPATRLWEFYELRSAWDGEADPSSIEIPRHIEDGEKKGHIDVGEQTGIVFVLLPGGSFWMGAQREALTGPNYDPEAQANEGLQRVTLAPFFLARHELTQGQWQRLTGGDPSYYQSGSSNFAGGRVTWTNPVEQVDWFDCKRWLEHYGMELPTEAQWEYGCRAGTTTPWWTGWTRKTLRGAVNLADQTARAGGAQFTAIADWPDLEDGFTVPGPVDALRPNAFGLHHVHGNVWEWTRDGYVEDAHRSAPTREGDGLRGDPEAARERVYRGGSFDSTARMARSASRYWFNPGIRSLFVGVRPARRMRLDD